MAYYLEMDGVDDRLNIPSMTFTVIELDFAVRGKGAFERYWSLPFGAEYFQVASGAVNDQWSAGVTMQIGGVTQTNVTEIMQLGVRKLTNASMAVKTQAVYVGHNNGNSFSEIDVYNLKLYNGATLVAHYDMTLGNVQDQSGNGRHATLTGGTWKTDSVGPVVHEVSGSASAVSSAQATATLKRYAIGSAQSVSSASAVVSLKSSVSGSAQAVSTASALARLKTFVSGAAFATSSAVASVNTGGAVHDVTGFAVAHSSASATVVHRSFVTATASVVSSATASARLVYNVTGAAVSQSIARLIESEPIIADAVLRAVRNLYGLLSAKRSLYGELRGELMTARNQNIELYAGESKYRSFDAFDEVGEPLDLTGGSVEWVLSKRGAVVMTKDLVITGTSYMLSIAPNDTAELAAGIYQYKSTYTDELTNVSVLATGNFTILD